MKLLLHPSIPTSVLLAALAPSGAAQAPTYTAEFLGNAQHVAAMNESGLVVGTGSIGIYARAYVAGPGKPITYLPLPLGLLSSGAADVNDAGVIVGVASPYQTTGIKQYPIRWDPDGAGGYTPTMLSLLPGDDRGTADAINDLGDVVGTSNYTSSLHTVLYADTGTVDLTGLASYPARSLNDQRVYVSGDARVHLDTLQVEPLGVPAGFTGASAWVINSTGAVAGDLATGVPGCDQEVGLYTDGAGWVAIGACGTSTSAYDLNDRGDVLMTQSGVPYVLFDGAGVHRVEDLIAGPGHWTPLNVFNMAMNGGRRIALYATDGTQTGIVLLTPEPTCQLDLGFGGPGSATLSMCGGDLSSGTTADIALTGAAPLAPAFFAAGPNYLPVPVFGGTAVPVPPTVLIPASTDAAGAATIPNVAGGHGPWTLYLQAAYLDAALPFGVGFSNALQVELLP